MILYSSLRHTHTHTTVFEFTDRNKMHLFPSWKTIVLKMHKVFHCFSRFRASFQLRNNDDDDDDDDEEEEKKECCN